MDEVYEEMWVDWDAHEERGVFMDTLAVHMSYWGSRWSTGWWASSGVLYQTIVGGRSGGVGGSYTTRWYTHKKTYSVDRGLLQ